MNSRSIKAKTHYDFHALIVAAGKGSRFSPETPKQYLPLLKKTVLEHSIEMFLSMPECKSLRVIINSEDAKWYQPISNKHPNIAFIEGGNERYISVYNGLKSISNMQDDEIVLVHDAARPCASYKDIYALLTSLKTSRAATLASQQTDTVFRSNNLNIATSNIERENMWTIQTPQAFRYGDILRAHESFDFKQIITDDTALLSKIGIDVKLVPSSKMNIKITFPEDYEMAETILRNRYEIRSGFGYDVHAFDLSKSGPIRLCGIDIPYSHSLKGHSDADVGLHALTDALLGAMGEGDIGRHFPPTDNQYKDMDSAIFLKKAAEMLKFKDGDIINIDLTLICEEPKITPHAAIMCIRIAEILQISEDRINIKATTTEQLGFTGRKEGIAAQALASIQIPCHNAP